RYFLDTPNFPLFPPKKTPGQCDPITNCPDKGNITSLCTTTIQTATQAYLPLQSIRTFTPGSTAGAAFLKDPLWYAAKCGGFKDQNNNGIPDLQDEWDANHDDTPDN